MNNRASRIAPDSRLKSDLDLILCEFREVEVQLLLAHGHYAAHRGAWAHSHIIEVDKHREARESAPATVNATLDWRSLRRASFCILARMAMRGEISLGVTAMTTEDAQKIAHGIIQGYIGPDHKVTDMCLMG